MLQLFPLAAWLAAMISAIFLALLSTLGELGRRSLVVLLSWFLLAGYCQFLAGSAVVRGVGLVLQTMLAIYLILRWKFTC